MATNPDQSRRNHEAELAAALLLLGSTYNLPQLIRSAKVKPRPFRRIEATEALRSSVAAPYFDLVRAWRAERDTLLAVYAGELSDAGGHLREGSTARIQRAVDQAAARIQLSRIDSRFPGILANLDRWHRLQWIARIQTAAGVNVSLFTAEHATRAEIENAMVRNEQLHLSLHEEAKNRVGTLLTNSLMALLPAAAVATAFSKGMDQSKARAARIGVDQTDMLTEALSRVRRREAGLARFKWHHTPQQHPRADHKARDHRIYTHSNAPNDRAGTLPFCKCWEEPLFD